MICVTVKFMYSYTIFKLPYKFGTRTYIGSSKYDFPICIVNPIKVKNIKKNIIYCLENKANETNQSNMENILSFFGTLDKPFDFDIVSVVESTEEIAINRNVNRFLLQQKENPEKKCVAIIDKKTNMIIRFEF